MTRRLLSCPTTFSVPHRLLPPLPSDPSIPSTYTMSLSIYTSAIHLSRPCKWPSRARMFAVAGALEHILNSSPSTFFAFLKSYPGSPFKNYQDLQSSRHSGCHSSYIVKGVLNGCLRSPSSVFLASFPLKLSALKLSALLRYPQSLFKAHCATSTHE